MSCKHLSWQTHNERPLRRCRCCGVQEEGKCLDGFFVFPDGTHVAVDQVAYCNALLREADAKALAVPRTALEEGEELHRRAEAAMGRRVVDERGRKLMTPGEMYVAPPRLRTFALCKHSFIRSDLGGGYRCDSCGTPAKRCSFRTGGVRCLTAFFGESSLCLRHVKLKAEAEAGGGLALRFKDATPAARAEQPVITCDLGADWDD